MMIQKKLTACVALLTGVFVGLSSGADTATPPAVVVEKASLWMDASQLTVGAELTTWSDARGGDYPTATTYTDVKPKVIGIGSGALAGKKAVDFGVVGTSCDMSFAPQHMKMAFFVVDIDQSSLAFWLGCHGDGYVPFHRADGGTYQHGHDNTNGCIYYNNGYKVADPVGTVVPTGYQLVTWAKGTNPVDSYVDGFTNDRNNGGRIGGKRLCEVILFDEQLSAMDQSRVEAYLRAKWFGEQVELLDYVLRKAQAHYDASVASSIHLGTEGESAGKVVQWDDLSGNGRTLTPGACEGKIVYGGLSTIGGRPVYDMGSVGSCIDLKMDSTLTTTRSVVMVTEIDSVVGAFWLGGDDYAFHRGFGGQYAYSNGNAVLDDSEGWQNGIKVSDMTGDKPNGLGGLSVYVFNMSANSKWSCLSRDRDQAGRNGGKRLAELLTFDFTLDDEARTALENHLKAKWSPTPEYIESLMAASWVHVSAAEADNFICTDNAITGWKNEGVGGALFKESEKFLPGACGYTNGVPAFLMGSVGSKIDLAFPRTTSIWNVFWVMDIQKDAHAFFLGDTDKINFHRGNGGQYAYEHSETIFKDASISCDGVAVSSPKDTEVPTGIHVFEAEFTSPATASRLSADRWESLWHDDGRSGGRALSELIILTDRVTGLTRMAMCEYLANRWTKRCGWAGAGDEVWGADKYRVFSSDGAVPAEGAAAAGIGFTGDATLSGGTLTLGAGGVFVSEGVVGAISAPIADGPTPLFGYGTFKVSAATDNRYDFTPFKGTLVLANGGRQTVNAYQPLANIPVTFEAGAKLRFDLAGYTEGNDVLATFASVTLPTGTQIADFVDFGEGVSGHSCILSTDGRSILHVGLTEPVTAVWTGKGDHANVNDYRNWACRSVNGELIDEAIPTTKTVITVSGETSIRVPSATLPARAEIVFGNDVSLAEDCDWRGLSQPLQGTVDLRGHKLFLSSLAGSGTLTDTSNTNGYQRLDFINSDGSNYIDTGYKFKTNTRIEAHFYTCRPNGGEGWTEFISAFKDDQPNNSLSLRYYDHDDRLNVIFCNDAYNQVTYAGMSEKDVVVELQYGSVVVNGERRTISSKNDPCDFDVFIFGGNGNGTFRRGQSARLYWLRIYEGETLVHDYVPARRNSDGAAGLLDLVPGGSGFLANARPEGKDFQYGPVVPEDEFARTGELHLDVSKEQQPETGATIRLAGTLKLVKEGDGDYRPAAENQRYLGGMEILGGTVHASGDGNTCRLGAPGNVIRIGTGGRLDMDGKHEFHEYAFVLDGGEWVNSTPLDSNFNFSQATTVRVTKDSTIDFNQWALIGFEYRPTLFDLGGHTVTMNTQGNCYFARTTATRGTIAINGPLQFYKGDFVGTNATLDINGRLSLTDNVDVHVGTYIARATTSEAGYNGNVIVYERFRPVTDNFWGCVLKNGVTLDLSERTTTWNVTGTLELGSYGFAKPTVTFEPGATIYVDFASRRVKSGEKVVGWTEDSKPPADVKFISAPGGKFGLIVGNDGIRTVKGLTIVIR